MMCNSQPKSFLCLAGYEKGQDFLRELKRQGCRVFLITSTKLKDAAWPHESLDDIFYMPNMYARQDMLNAVSYLARSQKIDRIVALDDLDVETSATLREHTRIPGMGNTTARYFRDKLAMRVKANDEGFLVPPFVHVLNYDHLRDYMSHVPAPWMLKPRTEASSLGIKKIHEAEQLWRALDKLGDRQSYYLLEKYVAGDVYHIDSIVWERKILFAESHKYARPLLDVMSGGGLFSSTTLGRASEDEQTLQKLNQELISAFGLLRGVTHTEFIKSQADGRFYFLETAARVGGANIAELITASTGLNLWVEWAKLEVNAAKGLPYTLPPHQKHYAGILISLARQEHPDSSAYNAPEIVWRLNKKHHAGLIVSSPQLNRVERLLQEYTPRFQTDFFAKLPPPEKATN
jgi:biotin carboxylase